jgi:hypothetical protein
MQESLQHLLNFPIQFSGQPNMSHIYVREARLEKLQLENGVMYLGE